MKEFSILDAGGDIKSQKIKINSTLHDIHQCIDKIKDELNKTSPKFNLLKNYCTQLVHRLPLPINNYNTFILRSRPNFNGEVFETKTDISYNPNFSESKASRFNLAGDSAFYGAVPLSTDTANGALTTILESLKEIFDDNHSIQEQFYTIGKWEMIKPIRLFALTFFDEAINKSDEVKRINNIFKKHLEDICNKKDQLKCSRFYGFVSTFAGKFCEDEKEYLLTTAFFQAIQSYYGEEIGILYSSAMSENTGLNIVLSKEILDNNYLKLTDVVMYRALRNPDNPLNFELAPYKIGSADSNGIITFGKAIDDPLFFNSFRK